MPRIKKNYLNHLNNIDTVQIFNRFEGDEVVYVDPNAYGGIGVGAGADTDEAPFKIHTQHPMANLRLPTTLSKVINFSRINYFTRSIRKITRK